LPSTLAPRCVRGGTPDDARSAGLSGSVTSFGVVQQVNPAADFLGGLKCSPATGATRLYVMALNDGTGGIYAVSDEYLTALGERYGLASRSCAAGPGAHEPWTSQSGEGLVACMTLSGRQPWVYFSFGEGRYLAFATRNDSNYTALYEWWSQLKAFLP